MSTQILNPFEIFGEVGEVPIMSFQTDKNGTFNPTFTLASGTLRWIIDGEEQITNSPSKALTGSTVDVEVFLNTVPQDETTTQTLFNGQSVIGGLNFDSFTINGPFLTNGNAGLNDIIFSTNANVSNNLRINTCGFTDIDLTNLTIGGTFFCHTMSSLTNITNPSYTTSLSSYRIETCALNPASVNGIFSSLNTFMSANAPTSNLSVNTSGGTNASPTGGSSNTDLVNLRDVVYPAAGFTFTATIN